MNAQEGQVVGVTHISAKGLKAGAEPGKENYGDGHVL